MHEAPEAGKGGWDCTGDAVVGDVEDGEAVEPADVGGDFTDDAVTDKVDDPEEGE